MNILILNWRDPQNPRSGGAEIVTYKYAQRWVSLGHTVTWICNAFPESKSTTQVSGVQYVRIGPALGYTVFELIMTYPMFLINAIFQAKKYLKNHQIDLVIDQIHGFPFFTPLYSSVRNVLWVCEVAGPIWNKMYPWPFSLLGRKLEELLYRLIYNRTEIWSISKSTQADVLRINPNANVKVIPLGISQSNTPIITKFNYPSAVFLARIVKMKGVEDALLIAKEITNKLKTFKLYLIGTGSKLYINHIRDMVKTMGIEENVEFMGRLSDSERNSLLAKCHFLLHPSYKEGFGLTVLEAGLVGTPCIARSGSSLDELVIDGTTGYLFSTVSQAGNCFLKGISNGHYTKLSKQAHTHATKYLWSRIFQKSDFKNIL